MWGVDDVCHKMSHSLREICGKALTEWETAKSHMSGKLKSRLILPLWSCQRQRELCHVLLGQDILLPATPEPGLSFCRITGNIRCRCRLENTGVSMYSCSPGVSAVETERDLIYTVWMNHHQVESRLEVLRWALFSIQWETLEYLIHRLLTTQFQWLYNTVKAKVSLPGSSWWLVSTLYRHVRRPSGWSWTFYRSCSQELSLFWKGTISKCHTNIHSYAIFLVCAVHGTHKDC